MKNGIYLLPLLGILSTDGTFASDENRSDDSDGATLKRQRDEARTITQETTKALDAEISLLNATVTHLQAELATRNEALADLMKENEGMHALLAELGIPRKRRQ